MGHKPKIGDVVFCVTDYMAEAREEYQIPVTQVDDKYFYAGDFVFEIETYKKPCGVWLGENKNVTLMHTVYAFVSKEVYEKQALKAKQSTQIEKAAFFSMSCAKVKDVYDLIFNTPDTESAEEWEL